MAVSDIEVLEMLDLLSGLGADPRVMGGWGVDALAERRTREHRDLDVAVRAEAVEACLDTLRDNGFAVSVDGLPARVELDDGIRVVDVHPLHYAEDGSAWQAGLGGHRVDYPTDAWTSGLVAGRSVVCLSPATQRRFHLGYAPRAADVHDLALLDEMESEP